MRWIGLANFLKHGILVQNEEGDENQLRIDEFLAPFEILTYNEIAARTYGDIRFQLEKSGKPIGPLDLLIAAHALSQNLILVTNNVKEFKRIKNLKVENWTK